MIIQRSHGVVVLAELGGCLEEDTADGDVVLLGEADPDFAHGCVGVCVVCCGCQSGSMETGRSKEEGGIDVPMATDLPACRCSSATFTHLSRCDSVSVGFYMKRAIWTYTLQGVLIDSLEVH